MALCVSGCLSAVFSGNHHRRMKQIHFNIIKPYNLGIINDVLLNYILCVLFFCAITATRFAHHIIGNLTAVEETGRLCGFSLCPTVRSAAVSISLCPNIYIECQAVSSALTD